MGYIPDQNARAVFTTVLANKFEDMIEAPSFLRSFGPDKMYQAKTVQLLARRGTEKVAVDVIRGSNGNLNEGTKMTLKDFLPPYYKEKINISSLNIYDIPFSANGTFNTAQIEAMAIDAATDLYEVKKMIDRAIELQAAEAFKTGIVTVASGDSIDYKRKATMLEIITGVDRWDQSGVDIIKFFEDKGRKLRTVGKIMGGINVNAILGLNAWQKFRANADIKDGENFYIKNALDLSPRMKQKIGGSYMGTLKAGGYSYDIWVYDETYENASGTETLYYDTNYVTLIPETFKAETSFAKVPTLPPFVRNDVRARRVFSRLASSMKGFSIFDYVSEDGENYFAGLKAAPLFQIIGVDQIYTARVIDPA